RDGERDGAVVERGQREGLRGGLHVPAVGVGRGVAVDGGGQRDGGGRAAVVVDVDGGGASVHGVGEDARLRVQVHRGLVADDGRDGERAARGAHGGLQRDLVLVVGQRGVVLAAGRGDVDLQLHVVEREAAQPVGALRRGVHVAKLVGGAEGVRRLVDDAGHGAHADVPSVGGARVDDGERRRRGDEVAVGVVVAAPRGAVHHAHVEGGVLADAHALRDDGLLRVGEVHEGDGGVGGAAGADDGLEEHV